MNDYNHCNVGCGRTEVMTIFNRVVPLALEQYGIDYITVISWSGFAAKASQSSAGASNST